MSIIERYRECSITGQVAWVAGVFGLLGIIVLAGIPSNQTPEVKNNDTTLDSNAASDRFKSFIFEFEVAPDFGSATVTESFRLKAGGDLAHGFFRIIPRQYASRSGPFRKVGIEVLEAEKHWVNGKASAEIFKPKIETDDNKFKVRLGDPKIALIPGDEYEFIIRYKLTFLDKASSDNPRVYWWITSELPRSIGQISGRVLFPESTQAGILSRQKKSAWLAQKSKALALPLRPDKPGRLQFSLARQLSPKEDLVIEVK